MEVKLINKPTLEFVDSGVGLCWGKGGYGADTDKGKERIDRVCNKFQHSSMLRFAQYMFEFTNANELFDVFNNSPFIKVEGDVDYFRVIGNAQALKGLGLNDEVLKLMIPIEHWYVFELNETKGN